MTGGHHGGNSALIDVVYWDPPPAAKKVAKPAAVAPVPVVHVLAEYSCVTPGPESKPTTAPPRGDSLFDFRDIPGASYGR